jgi:membrane-associated HD superfamily phosphohydrolase
MPPGTGRIIFEEVGRTQFGNLFGLGLGAELFYSFVIILCSLMIYFGTRELYELSSYKGIKYFRQAFLFFAIAYFFRSFIKFIVLYFNVEGVIDFSPLVFGATGLLTQLFFMYFSSMAIFYLLYSVMWRKWNHSSFKIYLFHGLAFAMGLISILSRNPAVYFGLNLFLLFVVVSVVYISHQTLKDKKKGSSLYLVYVLLSAFWILNIIDALIPKFFQGFQLFIYMASTGIFLFILYRVIKKTGSN